MKTSNSESESLWTKAPVANLVRYEPSGIYFARAKVRGKLIRKSLDTNVLSIAKLRLADVLDTEHKAVGATKTKIIGKMIFADALALFQEQQKISTEIKERSKEYNQRCADALLKTWKGLETLDIKRITKQDCLRWRAEFGNRYGATTTNGTLSILRRVFDIAVDTGARYDNPARMKEVKRARVRRKELRLPEPDQFAALIKEVRESGSGFSPHCADAIEFFSYAGPRLKEAARIFGRDCSFTKSKPTPEQAPGHFGEPGIGNIRPKQASEYQERHDEIVIRGDAKTGTKNWEIRRVPMIPEMRKLLERLNADRGEQAFLDNPVPKVRKFNRSLKRACKKLGLFHLTHHDLRHLFATRCIESGVDIPTVAKWLGHKDGGVLAMQTYGHLRDKHSADMAQKVVFAESPTALVLANVVALPTTSASNGTVEHHSPATVAKAKAKYSYPWWASESPAEVFWGQVNEAVQIVPVEKYIAAAERAMGREVFKTELSDPQALIAEFLERAPQPILKSLSAKIPLPKAEDRLAKAG